LPKDEKPCKDTLQHNYPVWFNIFLSTQDAVGIKRISPAARMIAAFEYAFPNAIWAFIGRDSSIFADLFTAFYFSVGQENRVIQVGMSRPTLKEDPSILYPKLLRYLTETLQIGKKNVPYVFVDVVSKGGGVQGRTILQVLGDHLLSKGIDDSQLFKRFNFIGLHCFNTEQIPDDWVNIHQVIDEQRRVADQNRILMYSDGRNKTGDDAFVRPNEAGYTHWIGRWHGSYGILREGEDGKISASYGAPEEKEIQEAWLLYRKHIIKTAISESFRNEVNLALQFLFKSTFQFSVPVVRLEASSSIKQKSRASHRVLPSISKELKALHHQNGSTVPPATSALAPVIRTADEWITKNCSTKKSHFITLGEQIYAAGIQDFLQLRPIIPEINIVIGMASDDFPMAIEIYKTVLSSIRNKEDFLRLRQPFQPGVEKPDWYRQEKRRILATPWNRFTYRLSKAFK